MPAQQQLIYQWACPHHQAVHQLIRGREFASDAIITEWMIERAKRHTCDYYANYARAADAEERELFPGWFEPFMQELQGDV